MDALRVWSRPSPEKRLLITSLDALLQRIPPTSIIRNSWSELAVGKAFDQRAFASFARCTGYIEEGIVDEPGEVAYRDDVIDIFPAGASVPMRIFLAEDGTVAELRSYDPSTQRTTSTVDAMEFGPASEAIVLEADFNDGTVLPEASECGLFKLYDDMQTVFDVMGDVDLTMENGSDDRLSNYLDIIDEARQARQHFDGDNTNRSHSLYLTQSAWSAAITGFRVIDLYLNDRRPLPRFFESANPRGSFIDFVKNEKQSGRTVVLAGKGQIFDGLVRRLERQIGIEVQSVSAWTEVKVAPRGAFLKLESALDSGFATARHAVITVKDVLGESAIAGDITVQLAEPDLMLDDVVVHEDHGIAVLKGMEIISVEGAMRDAARLEYRDEASLLVPMEEFDKIWRYGSEPEAVTLDRLHTEAWVKRRAVIDKDIRLAARHLMRIAKERRDAPAETFVPRQTEFSKFARRFPYAETAHQAAAIEAVLADLASGTVMSRLICGDVGFGKTEVALRAAAAVAFAGGQVAIVVPTTVLARQHLSTFERRFADTGIRVAMLSRVVERKTANEVKAGLACGEIGIVIATQAILAKDIRFAHLGLLIVDEEHRFGTRQKQAMKALAPLLHTLVMSATPIPRTLQSALIGVQDVSVLATAPSKRRPVRTSLTSVDRASMRIALMREYRRGGQSFLVVPQIEDLDPVGEMLRAIVPELSLRVAHGKMQGALLDETMVSFADGDGDVLVSTNIIETGLDVPRANTIFIWRADRFGLAQLHQLRGRVGRGRAQGMAYLLTPEEGISEETRLRLLTMVEKDRLGAGLAISMQDLDLRGGGDIIGDNQAGHMKSVGVRFYQKLLERAVTSFSKRSSLAENSAVLNLGIAGSIPPEYISEGAVRLNLYARLLRATTESELEDFAGEFEDRFGELPEEVSILFRLARLRIVARRFGIGKLDGGPLAMAMSFTTKPTKKTIISLTQFQKGTLRDGRLIFEKATDNGIERMAFFEQVFAKT
ncbi:DEAD/DEAH box helicase [Rhizobium sp. P38BS-XIX]|uniref:DEAD/DEAH box helicase n=1 Tax=Rhizobium sp. P38BS-XIX TaxID=2726740 RepID=UPI001FEECB67|nr:DEAD/DEAH box helicase [Rhizobium sp. P38BS-XIX]